MSDHLQSFGASDSGFLNAFSGILHGRHGAAPRGHESRLEGDSRESHLAADNAQLDRLLRDVAPPEGLVRRLRQIVDES